MKIHRLAVPALLLCVLTYVSCGTGKHIRKIEKEKTMVALKMPKEDSDYTPDLGGEKNYKAADSIIIKDESGKDLILMNSIKDDATGEMVATDSIKAAVVVGRFKRVAERGGKLDLKFQIEVPKEMIDKRWQITLEPELYLMNDKNVMFDSTRLDKILITGETFRKHQLEDYASYERYLNSITTDTSNFQWKIQLKSFLERNIPDYYNPDLTEPNLLSYFNVTDVQAIKHYSREWLAIYNNKKNEKKIERKDIVFKRRVKEPFAEYGVRLDSVAVAENGNFIYDYVQTINTQPHLKKAFIYLSGDIHNPKYPLVRTDSIEYNISTLNSFAKDRQRFLKKVIYRKAETNASFNIHFPVAKWDIKPDFENNAEEITKINKQLHNLLVNTEYDLDSIIVTANCSPEGKLSMNSELSKKRSKSVTDFFGAYVKSYCDSVNRNRGMFMDLDGNMVQEQAFKSNIRFIPKPQGENWKDLDILVGNDATLAQNTKDKYFALKEIKNLDDREWKMKKIPEYSYIFNKIYPKLRSVRFDFHLHRKGMIKDTIQTTEPDTLYAAGLHALRESDYQKAIDILCNYPDDYNTAVAYIALDKNLSAKEILESLDPEDGDVKYLLAIIYSRLGETQKAVQHYMDAVTIDYKYKSRGNLDPEIIVLIKRYNLFKEDDYAL